MKKQIPNILSAIRLCCVPVFIWLILQGERVSFDRHRIAAACVFFGACCTDVLDGMLARKKGWITPLGKFLDPIADKSMQFAVMLSLTLTSEGKTFVICLIVLILLIIKELLMLAGGMVVLRVCKDVVVSAWYGKLATTVFFVITMTLILLPEYFTLSLILCILLICTLVFALLMYYIKIFRGQYGMKRFSNMTRADFEEKQKVADADPEQ
ncbi:MAG: CDP-alcohol phosphatidyltransferase family protein [Clostridiales bacterium]|nr:CDP-alcohol phosphatidyltransferase family protein [Candidatus Coliplasma caballi]